MKALLIALLVFPLPAAKVVTVTNAAAVTTIAVNALEIKSTIQKARAAARTAKKTAAKVARKIRGK